MTVEKFANPTHVAGWTRFVCCSDMITVRTIGYQENAPKMHSIGSRKSSVVRPPPRTHVPGVRRGRNCTRVDSRVLMDLRFLSRPSVTGSTADCQSDPQNTSGRPGLLPGRPL